MNRRQRRAAAKSSNVEALCALAAARQAEGKIDEAIEKYRRALTLKPNLAEAHNNLANLLRERGRLDEAIEHYNKALELAPGTSETYNNLGNAVKQRGRPDAAVPLYRQAIALRPDFPEPHNNLGSALLRLGDVNGAIAHFKRAVELKPDCMEARLNLGLAYVERGCNVEALEQAEVASRSATQPSFPHHLLGVLLARCGCTEAARICFDAHLERDPDDREGVRLLLSGLGHVPLPERASSAHLDRIYADRATYWDRAKGDTMGYRGADLVASVLDRLAVAGAQLDILDAGCGTGLVGGLVAKKARRLIGVDMSGPMLAKAKEKGVYHGLHQGDLVAFLNANAEGFDVVTCAATLIHFGDLRPAFAAAAACLRDRGLFILTLFPDEKNEDGFASGSLDGYAQGGCFSHGRGYVARTAEATGFVVETLELGVHEYFQKQPRMGLVVALRRLARGQAQARAACLDSSEAPTAPAAGDGMTANGVIEPA